MLCIGAGTAFAGTAKAAVTLPPRADKAPSDTAQKTNSSRWEQLVMQPFHDDKGQVMVELPMPATWKIAKAAKRGEPTIVGPHNVKVIDFPLQSFIYTHNPQLQGTYRQAGQRLRSMPKWEEILQQDIVPWATGQGLTLLRSYEIPEITRIDKWYNDQLYKAVPMKTHVVAYGVDWTHTETGHRFFMVVHLVGSATAELQTWYYYYSGLQAEKAHFDTARKQLIFALANARYNLSQIADYNRAEAEKAGKSWAAHNDRMARNQAAFEASQRAFVNRSTAAHDSLMRTWNEKNAATDRAHERFIDTITERQNVVNPTTGTRYKVESGPNQYWMNSSGEYISTDNPSYDPNLDKNLNHHNWQELKKTE